MAFLQFYDRLLNNFLHLCSRKLLICPGAFFRLSTAGCVCVPGPAYFPSALGASRTTRVPQPPECRPGRFGLWRLRSQPAPHFVCPWRG